MIETLKLEIDFNIKNDLVFYQELEKKFNDCIFVFLNGREEKEKQTIIIESNDLEIYLKLKTIINDRILHNEPKTKVIKQNIEEYEIELTALKAKHGIE
ncbi:MAG: hypothetical protein ACRC4M_02625 [Mycoplasma sp.]